MACCNVDGMHHFDDRNGDDIVDILLLTIVEKSLVEVVRPNFI